MPRVTWLLENNFPVIKIRLTDPTGFTHSRTLLADTGAGPHHAPFEVVLSELDIKQWGGRQYGFVGIGGAISGEFPIHSIWLDIPALTSVRQVRAVAVPTAYLPDGLDGIASFQFLNSFSYGNFNNPNQFGLETL